MIYTTLIAYFLSSEIKRKYEYMGLYICMTVAKVWIFNWNVFIKFSKKIIPSGRYYVCAVLFIVNNTNITTMPFFNGKHFVDVVIGFESLRGITS
jgi:hypothetical protein